MAELKLPVDTFVSSTQITARIWRYGKGYNRFVDCDMVFDTGASMTTFDKGLAVRAGYDLNNALPIEIDGVGRSGIPGVRITIPHLELGGYDIGPVTVDVVEFPESSNTVALLGMNVIRHFKSIIEIQNQQDESYNVSEPDGLITLIPNFDLNEKPTMKNFMPYTSRFGVWTIANNRNG